MPNTNETALVKSYYFEWDIEVDYKAYPPVYGSAEPDSGGLYLGGPSNLSEVIHIEDVRAIGPNGKTLSLMPLMDAAELMTIGDEILERRKD